MGQVDEPVCVDEANFVLLISGLGDGSYKRRMRKLKARYISCRFPCVGDSVSLTLSIGKVLVGPESTTDKPVAKKSSTKDFSD